MKRTNRPKDVFVLGLTFNQFMIATALACAGLLLLWLTVKADTTFTYSKTIQNSAGLPADGAIVKAYRGVNGTLYATDTCSATGTFSFTLSDSFAFYKIEATNWDVNAPWRPMTWVLETELTTGLINLGATGRLTAAVVRNPDSLSTGRLRSTGTVSARGLVVDTLVTDSLSAKGFMRQRIGASPASFNWGATAVAFRFDDISEDSLHLVAAILDTMRHYGVRATFALCYRHVKGLPESFNYTTSNFSGLGEIRNLVAAGHEGADHSPAHWFPPGQTAAKYQSCIDSSRTWFRTYLGVEPRLFIQPGGTQNGTPLFDEAFRAAVSNNYDYGMTWIQQEWPGNPKSDRLKMIYGTQHANSSRYWLPSWSFDLYDMAMAQKTFAEYLPVNGFFSVYMHLTNTTQVKQASMFMKFLDSLGVSMIPVSEMADLYVGSRWPNSGNLFSNTNLLCKIANLTLVGTSGSHWECPDGVRIMNTHSVTWDYLYPYATPCSDKGGAIKMSLSSEPHPHFPDNGAGMLFRVDGIEPGARYRVSVYIKNPNAGSFTEVPHIAVRQLKDCGYSPVVGTTHIDSLSLVRPDSTWHYWSHEITAQDSTDQIGLYVYAGTYGGYVIVACPSIEQVGPAGGAVIPTGGFLPLKGYLSADADTAYVQKVDGTYGKIPIQ